MHFRKVDTAANQKNNKGYHIYNDVDEKNGEQNNSDLSFEKVAFEMDGMEPPALRSLSNPPLYDNFVCRQKSNSNDDDGVEIAKENKSNQLQKAEK